MTRTKIDGRWVNDPIRQATSSRQPAQNQQLQKLQAQHNAMALALASISQCKSIVEVRKCLVHARAVYPR